MGFSTTENRFSTEEEKEQADILKMKSYDLNKMYKSEITREKIKIQKSNPIVSKKKIKKGLYQSALIDL